MMNLQPGLCCTAASTTCKGDAAGTMELKAKQLKTCSEAIRVQGPSGVPAGNGSQSNGHCWLRIA